MANAKNRRSCANPTAEIVKKLESCAEQLKECALLVGEYATQFDGQQKADMDAVMNKIHKAAKQAKFAAVEVEYAEDAK